jgi:hypothetical protein
MDPCLNCGEMEKRRIKHHIDYEKDITVSLCDSCHIKLHRGNLTSNIPAPNHPPYKRIKSSGKPCKITRPDISFISDLQKNGRITIPANLLRKLGIEPGSVLELEIKTVLNGD